METRYDTGYEEVLHSYFYISQVEYHLDYLWGFKTVGMLRKNVFNNKQSNKVFSKSKITS